MDARRSAKGQARLCTDRASASSLLIGKVTSIKYSVFSRSWETLEERRDVITPADRGIFLKANSSGSVSEF